MSKVTEVIKSAKFYIDRADFNKIIEYAGAAYKEMTSEIAGMMVVLKDSEGDYIIQDPVILKQVVDASTCTLQEEALALYYSRMINKYPNQQVRYLWWHSHHTMGAFWSGTDDATILKAKTNDFSLSLVVNLKRDYKLRIQWFEPIESYVDTELHFLQDEVNSIITDEVAKLCTKNVIVAPVSTAAKPWNFYSDGYNKPSINDVNDCDTYAYGAYGYGAYSKSSVESSIFEGLTPAVKTEVLELVDLLHDRIIDAYEINYPKYTKEVKKINKTIKKHGLKMLLLEEKALETSIYSLWPEDYLRKNVVVA